MQSMLARGGVAGLRLALAQGGRSQTISRSKLKAPIMAQRGGVSGKGSFGSVGPYHGMVNGMAPSSTPKAPDSKRSVSMRGVGGGASGGATVPPAGGSSGGGGGGGGSSSSGAGLWAGYLRSLQSQPILTKAITAAVLNGIGDLIAQFAVEKKDKLDVGRFIRFAGLGLLMIGPVLHYWYGLNARLVSGTGTVGALGRLAMDQLLFAPPFVAANFAVLKLLEGKPGEVVPKLKQDLREAVFANWKLWPTFQFINFRFVPPEQRVLFSSMVSLIWNTYLSFAGHIPVELIPGIKKSH